MHKYELIYILQADLDEATLDVAVENIETLIKSNKGEITKTDRWGKRKLAYPIQKKSTGFYHLIEFKADASIIREWEVTFKRDERILRFLTVVLDKHMLAYNEKKRNKAKAAKEEKAQ